MATKRHKHDHIRTQDEAFLYRGEGIEKLKEKYMANKRSTRLLKLQGFPFSGKTRLSKELVLRVAEDVRAQFNGSKEIHTFYIDVRCYHSVDELRHRVSQELLRHVSEWPSSCDLNAEESLFEVFGNARNGSRREFYFIFDNVDRVIHKARSYLLQFIENMITSTSNVYVVLASRIDIAILIRDPGIVQKHQIQPLSIKDGKALLRDMSGNPPDLETHADEIVRLLKGSPFAIMVAGYQMNKEHSPYSLLALDPDEIIYLMKRSIYQTLELDNVPQEDQICQRIREIVAKNFDILESVFLCLQEAESFCVGELYTTLTNMPSAEIKQMILHILLSDSTYILNQSEPGIALDASPFVVEFVKELFCQMTTKDAFLRNLNEALIEITRDTELLKTQTAMELKEAQWHLLKRQKECTCTSEQLKLLRENVIITAEKFVGSVTDEESASQKFSLTCQKILSDAENAERGLPVREQTGVQETSEQPLTRPVPCSQRDVPGKNAIHKTSAPHLTRPVACSCIHGEAFKEPEACLCHPLTSENRLQDPDSAGIKKTTEFEQPAKIEGVERESKVNTIHAKLTKGEAATKSESTILQSHDSTTSVAGEKSPNRESLKESASGIVSVGNEGLPNTHQSPSSVEGRLPNQITDSENLNASVTLSVINSLHSNNLPYPTQEYGQKCGRTEATYSTSSTLPEQHAFIHSSHENETQQGVKQEKGPDTREGTTNRNEDDYGNKAVESEFDWEKFSMKGELSSEDSVASCIQGMQNVGMSQTRPDEKYCFQTANTGMANDSRPRFSKPLDRKNSYQTRVPQPHHFHAYNNQNSYYAPAHNPYWDSNFSHQYDQRFHRSRMPHCTPHRGVGRPTGMFYRSNDPPYNHLASNFSSFHYHVQPRGPPVRGNWHPQNSNTHPRTSGYDCYVDQSGQFDRPPPQWSGHGEIEHQHHGSRDYRRHKHSGSSRGASVKHQQYR